jgi:hypothetical protein
MEYKECSIRGTVYSTVEIFRKHLTSGSPEEKEYLHEYAQ